jgi:hypothetical protein
MTFSSFPFWTNRSWQRLFLSALAVACLQEAGAAPQAPEAALPAMASVNPLAIAVSTDVIDWDQCISFGDGHEVGKAPRETLLSLLGLSGIPPKESWSTGPLAGEVRHFRIAFRQPVPAGTICLLAEGGFPAVSFLKDSSQYPGDVTNEANWVSVSSQAVNPLPTRTAFRAIRFTHRVSNQPWENSKRVSGMPPILILNGRFWSPVALGSGSDWSKASPKSTGLDRWTGSWPVPLPVAGLATLDVPAGKSILQALPESVIEHALEAGSNKWNKLTATASGAGPAVVALDSVSAVKGLRLDNPSLPKGRKASPVLPLVALGDGEMMPKSFVPDPPFRFKYDMPLGGFMAIRIADGTNPDLRRLIAEVERPQGRIMEAWDLKDEAGRYVKPGKYSWYGLARPPLKLTYEMTVYNAGHPPWMAPVPGGGWWMADHCPPRAVCAVKDRMFFGAQGAEFGIPLIATDPDGRKVWHFDQGVNQLVSDGQFAYVVNDDAIIRFDPTDGFARKDILHFPYSEDIPNRAATWLLSEESGAACGNGLMAVSYNSPEPPWITSAIKPNEVDLKACVPAVTGEKVHETDYTPAQRILGTFLTIDSSTAARFGAAAEKGPTAHTLVLALTKEMPVGSVMIPGGNLSVWALRPGKALPAGFKNKAPAAADADLLGKSPDEDPGLLSLDAAGDGRFAEEEWIPLKTGVTGSSDIAMTPENGIKTRYLAFYSKTLGTLDCALVLNRRFRNAAPDAALMVLEGQKAGASGWSTSRTESNPLSSGNPAIAAYVWPKAVPIRGFALLHPMKRAGVAFDLWVGPEDATINSEALKDDANWKKVYQHVQNENHIKMGWHANSVIHFDLGATTPVRALRIRLVTMPTRGASFSGGFDSLVAFQPLGGDPELPPRLTQRVTIVEMPKQEAPARVLKYLSLPTPGPLTFDKEGSLYVACTQGIVRIRNVAQQPNPPTCEPVIPATATQNPRALAFGPDGLLYVLNGAIKAVQVFDPQSGRQVRTIGTPGGPHVGPWDPTRLTEPVAMTIDAQDKLWIVDCSFQPKRISRWSLDGRFEKDLMGPTHYGGGGIVDPGDHTVVNHLGMKFRMDFTNRTWRLESILHGYESRGMYMPDRPMYYGGHRYLIGDHPVVVPFGGGGPIATICKEQAGVAVPLVAMGLLNGWTSFGGNAEVLKLYNKMDFAQTSFVWTDLNRDSKVQPDEVQLLPGAAFRGIAGIGEDLSLNFHGCRIRLKSLRADGLPLYDIKTLESVPELTSQCLVTTNGETFVMGHKFLDRSGKLVWSYPDYYGSVQASYQTPWGFYERPAGKLCGGMWTAGYFKAGGEDLFCVNGNNGDYYSFTRDGLLAAAIVGGPQGYGRRFFSMPECEPGKTDLSDLRKTVEQFGGWVSGAEDGKVYATVGKNHVSVVRVDGLDKMQRVQGTLEVTTADLQAAMKWAIEKGAIEQATRRASIFNVPYLSQKPTIDGNVTTDWPIDKGMEIHVARNPKGEIIESWKASLAYDSDCLYVMAKAVESSPMMNSVPPEDRQRLFQFGDGFDLNLGLDPKADPRRQEAVPGDIRLVISMVAEKPMAMLYRYKVPGGSSHPVTFTSPVGEIVIDEIRELTDAKISIQRHSGDEQTWTLEAAIPWKSLGGMAPTGKTSLKGDVGVLVSDPSGLRAITRYYWANHSNVVMSDLPSEARVLPGLWGEFKFEEFDMTKSIEESLKNTALPELE